MAKLILGKAVLPSKTDMLGSIESDKARMRKRYKQSPRHTLQVDFYPYKAEIEREMRRKK